MRQLKGETLVQCSQKLGLPASRRHRWLGQPRQRAAEPPPEVCPDLLLRPVEETAEVLRVSGGIAEKRYTVRAPGEPDQALQSGRAGTLFTPRHRGGADSRKGWFADADGGSLFFDEVGDTPLALQAKLLHVLSLALRTMRSSVWA